MTPYTHETQIQNNTIDLLKNMDDIYIFHEEIQKLFNGKVRAKI